MSGKKHATEDLILCDTTFYKELSKSKKEVVKAIYIRGKTIFRVREQKTQKFRKMVPLASRMGFK